MLYPKISVVTPNYNLEKYLEKTIQSIIYQGYPNLEYIIIDGGSTDDSIEIIRKYEKHITYWVSEKDEGLYDALNKGFSKATGEIFMYINSDDCLMQGSLKLIGKSFAKFPSISWMSGYYSFLNEHDEITKVAKNRCWSIIDYLNGNYQWIQQESTVWRKELWNKAGGRFETNFKYAADTALWCEFFLHENPVIADFSIGAFRIRDNQMSIDNVGAYHSEAIRATSSLKNKVDKATLKNAKKHAYLDYLIRIFKKTIIFDNNIFLKQISRYQNKFRGPTFRITYIKKEWNLIEDGGNLL